ncbi:MAG TPA: hypothetical protein VK779_11710 [Rhizomicrobium sp.]|nr:hypothetical protein [Rhizomicrobium sp.]
MGSFHELIDAPLMIDARDHIGPHHLAIGKTRKLFARGGIIHAFFSIGYGIMHARIDERFDLIDKHTLDLPIAWGGGAFCVDDHDGRVVLVFLHRNQHELCVITGDEKNGEIVWQDWRTLLVSRARQAAPWVEIGPDGTAWASVLDRDGDMRLIVLPPNGNPRVGGLFEAGEARWYHSCVQVEPIAKDKALAIGFRGEFPSRTELVYKIVSSDLKLGPAKTLARCNVNDRLTFHFQAVGDAARSRAHIVYLDNGLSVSHALFENDAWHVTENVLSVACFAPQIAIDEAGNAALIAPDYDGQLWTSAWSKAKGWCTPKKLRGLAPNVSMQFAQTGYGTGGLISAARSTNGSVPFLFARIENDQTAHAKLYASRIGGEALFDVNKPLSIAADGKHVEVGIRLAGLHASDLKQTGRRWVVAVPAEAGRALKLEFKSLPAGLAANAYWLERDGRYVADVASVKTSVELCDAFSHNDCGVIRASLDLSQITPLATDQAWVEAYAGATLLDIAPFDPETAAKMALSPEGIPRAFKRMV